MTERSDEVPAEEPAAEIVGTWDGVVMTIGRETFRARVIPVGIPGPEQVAEFALQDVSASDAGLFRKGATFYWTIAYRTSSVGRVRRSSEIRFRRLPPVAPREGEQEWVDSTLELFTRRDAP